MSDEITPIEPTSESIIEAAAPIEKPPSSASSAAGCYQVAGILLVLFSSAFAMTAAWFLTKRLQGLRVPTWAMITVTLAAIGLLFSIRLRPKIRPRILMMTLSVLLTLYAAEGVMARFGSPIDYDYQWWMQGILRGQRMDNRLPLDVLIDAKDAGEENVTLAIPAAAMIDKRSLPYGDDGDLIFPLSNVANTTAIYCNELGEYVRYDTDELGLHNPRGIWSDGIDIAIVGDSFANGACVPSDTNAVHHIRETHPRTVTVGSSGSGPLLELAAFKEYVVPKQPSVVMWWYFEGNDLLDIQAQKKDWFIEQYLDSDFSQNLIERQTEVDRVREEYIANIEQIRRDEIPDATDLKQDDDFSLRKFATLFELRRLLKIDFASLDYINSLEEEARLAQRRSKPAAQETSDDPCADSDSDSARNYCEAIQQLPENLSILKRTLVEARDLTHGWGGEFVVVYIPQWERYENQSPDNFFFRKEVNPLLNELEVPIIDLKVMMDDHDDPLSLYPFRNNGHYNPDGYKWMADVLVGELEQFESLGR